MKIFTALILTLLLVSGIIFQLTMQTPPELQVTNVYPDTKLLPEFNLINHQGQAFTNESLQDKWSIVFFGYTFCPDICPTTMAALAQSYKQLSVEQQNRVQFVFVSVDPERDTVDILSKYVPFYNPDFIGITGENEGLLDFAMSLGAAYMKLPSGDSYMMSHSSTVFIVDPKGQRLGQFSRSAGGVIDSKLVAEDLQTILEHY